MPSYLNNPLIFVKTGNPESISKGYNNLAAAYKRLGMFDDAGKLYLDSLALKNGGEFTASYALGLGNLAELRKSQGRFQRGVWNCIKELEIYDKVYSGNRMFKDVGVSVNGYAGAYYGLKNYPKAIELYRQALEILRRCNGESSLEVARGKVNLAHAIMASGKSKANYEECRELLGAGYEIRKDIPRRKS